MKIIKQKYILNKGDVWMVVDHISAIRMIVKQNWRGKWVMREKPGRRRRHLSNFGTADSPGFFKVFVKREAIRLWRKGSNGRWMDILET